MRTIEDLLKTPRLLLLKTGLDGGWAEAHLMSNQKHTAFVVFSNGGGWDHVSVSYRNRCPTWDEMCEVKKMFFYPEEICVEYHPPESEYVNQHQYCLHLWRYQREGMPMPPAWMVGTKRGQTMSQARSEAMKALETMDD